MNISRPSKASNSIAFSAVIAAMAICGLASPLIADDTPARAPTATNAGPANATAPDTSKSTVKKHLTGAELYSIHCNRCHLERYPTERTAAQWKTIMLHMQIRANLPVSQAKLILQYLQENSGR